MIGDLGHAKYLENNSMSQTNSNRTYGTNNYLAPEANSPLRETNKIDIWFF